MAPRWIPLESNPEVMNQWAATLGIDTDKISFCDIYGLDPELLDMVPSPTYAVILCFPISEAYEKARIEEDKVLKQIDEERKLKGESDPSKDLIYIKQLIGNACGTMGLLHVVLNTPSIRDQYLKDGALTNLYYSFLGKTPLERGELLNESTEVATAHEASASVGQTEAPSADDSVDLHFVAFIEWNGHLWELDGRKNYPVDHGTIQGGKLLYKVADVVKENFVKISAGSVQFNLIALAQNSDD